VCLSRPETTHATRVQLIIIRRLRITHNRFDTINSHLRLSRTADEVQSESNWIENETLTTANAVMSTVYRVRETRGRRRKPIGNRRKRTVCDLFTRKSPYVSEIRFRLFFRVVSRVTCVARRDARLTVYGARRPPADTERCSHRRHRRCRAKRVPPARLRRFRKVDALKTASQPDRRTDIAPKIGTSSAAKSGFTRCGLLNNETLTTFY